MLLPITLLLVCVAMFLGWQAFVVLMCSWLAFCLTAVLVERLFGWWDDLLGRM